MSQRLVFYFNRFAYNIGECPSLKDLLKGLSTDNIQAEFQNYLPNELTSIYSDSEDNDDNSDAGS